MRLNKSFILSPNVSLVINCQIIYRIDDLKYLGSYVRSKERDVKVRIELAFKVFAKVNSILRSPKVKLNFTIRLFKATYISILLYGCETWILTEAFIDKLGIYSRTCYLIKLGIKQSRDHVKKTRPMSLY